MTARKIKREGEGVERGGMPSQRGRTAPRRARPTLADGITTRTHEQ
jgi:hypothetical protein